MSNFCVAHHLLNIVTMNILCSQIVVFEIDCIISLYFNCVSYMTMCAGHMTMCAGHMRMCESYEHVHSYSVMYSADFACIVHLC